MSRAFKKKTRTYVRSKCVSSFLCLKDIVNIDGKTRVYGVIGYPIKHTFSPLMHNAAFKSLGMNAVYLAFEIKPKYLKSALSYMKSMGVRGFNATIPHKEKLLKYLDEIDKEASLIKAVNTVAIKNGRLKGFNTDGRGFIGSLKEEFGISPKGKNFFIMGAGGASRAVSFSLALSGANRIVLVDEIRGKAIKLAGSLSRHTSCEAVALKKDKRAMKELIFDSDVFVNATPCGMKPSDPRLIDPALLHKGLFVYDLIYNPRVTKLLKDAGRRGARVSSGIGMLLNQGAISFNIWTGRKPPIRVMRKALGR
jgi:shikimate dehydrogenase